MIAKLCCWGRNRDSAISNMARALREYKILGIKTTIPFHQRVLKNAAFLKGEYDTTFIDTRFDKEDLKRRQNTDPTVAVIAAALKHYEEEKEAVSTRHYASGSRRFALEILRQVANDCQ